jgi:riboflavin kinase/FMN adenylyltransferase
MQLDWETETREKNKGAWITIGSFDGIHLGHQAIIKELVRGSHRSHDPAVVVTFFPHPSKVLGGTNGRFYLTLPEEKDQMLAAMGVSSVLTLKFDRVLASQSAEEFIRMLHQQMKFSCLLVGFDFRLGANRSGDIHTLSQLGKELGYCVHTIQPFRDSTQTVSSTIIRDMIKKGDIWGASRLLNRLYSVQGKVVHGDGRGKHIGLPTANLDIWKEKLLPGAGVYAAWADLNGQKLASVVNIGYRPTFYDQPEIQTIEAYLLDFNQDIYGKNLQLDFIKCIRPEIKFSSADELMQQIKQDIDQSHEVFSHVTTQKHLFT